jgi:hypothetical protein
MSEFTADDLGVGLDDLIGLVETGAPDGDEITRLSTAVAVSERLGDLGDHLVGHFVDEARKAGASWREIGSGIGVTKQAAQKRFVPGAGDVPEGGMLSRFTPRARAVLETARAEANQAQASEVRTEHLALGLLADRQSLAAKALHAQGVKLPLLRARVAALGGKTVKTQPERTKFAPDARKTLELAVREALRLGHNYIGTEHLLLGLLADPGGTGRKVLLDAGLDEAKTQAWILQALDRIVKQRKAETA